MFLQTHDIRHNLHALGSYISRVSISGFPSTTPTHVSGDETSTMGVTDRVPPFLLWCAESECRSGSTMQVHHASAASLWSLLIVEDILQVYIRSEPY